MSRKITQSDIEALILNEITVPASEIKGIPPGFEKLTLCLIAFSNGFTIVGTNYGTIDPAEFSSEVGAKMARQNAIDQMYPILGYHIREELDARKM